MRDAIRRRIERLEQHVDPPSVDFPPLVLLLDSELEVLSGLLAKMPGAIDTDALSDAELEAIAGPGARDTPMSVTTPSMRPSDRRALAALADQIRARFAREGLSFDGSASAAATDRAPVRTAFGRSAQPVAADPRPDGGHE